MKTKLIKISGMILTGLLCFGYAQAEESDKMVIALKTNDFDLQETDISQLEVGESETIMTDSGKVIDILRTAEGVELYVDGVLLEMPHLQALGEHESEHESEHDGEHGMMHKKVIIECDADQTDCSKEIMVLPDGDLDMELLHGSGDHHVIVKKLDSECLDDETGECELQWFSDDDSFEFEEWDAEGVEKKVIRIHGSHEPDNQDHAVEKKVIVIRKS